MEALGNFRISEDGYHTRRSIMKSNKKELTTYLLVTFILAWIMQIGGAFAATILKNAIGAAIYQVLITLCMFAPMVGVLVIKKGIKQDKSGISWKVDFKRNWKSLVFAWFMPMIFTVIGAVLYFVIFRSDYDPNMGMIMAAYDTSMGANAGTQSLSAGTIVFVSVIQAITYAPFLNMVFAVGEEVGWRGYMTPVLQHMIGRKKGLILAGVIWGIWHAPLIVLAGYEYGTGYFGAPVSGVLIFCVFTIALAIISTWLYEKTDCIWIPAIFHGAINGAAGIPLCFTDGTLTGYPLGPLPNGLISVIPMLIFAIFVMIEKQKEDVLVNNRKYL